MKISDVARDAARAAADAARRAAEAAARAAAEAARRAAEASRQVAKALTKQVGRLSDEAARMIGRTSSFDPARQKEPVELRGERLSGARRRLDGTGDDSIGGGDKAAARDVSGDNPRFNLAQRGTVDRSGLTPTGEATLERLLGPQNDERRKSLDYVLRSEAFSKLPGVEKERMLNVLDRTSAAGTASMARLIETNPGALTSPDKDGASLLTHLERMSNKGLPGLVNETLDNVLADIASPARIWQATAPTCTVASMQHELAGDRPGEYGRIMADLAEHGRSRMLGGGELRLPRNTLESLGRDGRSVTETLFQSAAMDFANGRDAFDPVAGQSVGAEGAYRGLHAEQIITMAGELFGRKYETRQLGSRAEAMDELFHLRRERKGPNRPVLFDIDMGPQNHTVSFLGVRDGMVSFMDTETGKKTQMSVDEFGKRAVAVHYAAE